MAGKQAKILSDQAARDLLFFATTTRHPDRNRVIVKAGLRAAEIAKLTWDMVESAEGEIGSTIEVRDNVAKKAARPPNSHPKRSSRSANHSA
jgi:hypothetical protein